VADDAATEPLAPGAGDDAAARSESVAVRSERIFDLARTTAFSDGVFAIAITLLVLTIDVPKVADPSELARALGDLSESFRSYAISFAVIGLLWFRHHRMFACLGEVDARMVVLNLVYLAFVAFIPFPTDVLGEYGGEPVSVALYAGTIAAVGLLAIWMWIHAFRAGLLSDAGAEQVREYSPVTMAIVPAVMLASIPVAYLVSPYAAEYVWLLIFLGRFVARRTAPRFGDPPAA
jgi:uncharacterized membrane protein